MRILFTCMGTSDPVRGYRDGPMLHILRWYRPEKVWVFLTEEAAELNRKGDRINAMAQHMRENWDGYAPEIELCTANIADPSDLDAVSSPITEQVRTLSNAQPEAEILLNLSSGTPQMKQVLSMLAADARYPRLRGIQVKNPERASGTTERTNKGDYSVSDELVCNEDEEAGAQNRCSEPELLHMKKQQAKEQILALLEQRNYTAVYAMKNSMPDSVKALVGHLEARDKLQDETARKRAQNLKLPFPLYPAYPGSKGSDYKEVSEAYLVLLNRQHRQQYEEMVLRLNPLVVRLQLRMIKNALYTQGCRLENIIERPYSMRPRFVPDKLRAALPAVYAKVESAFATPLRESDVSMFLCNRILEQLPAVDRAWLDILYDCEKLNDSCRNELAHQLTSVTAEQLRSSCGMEPAQLLRKLGDLIAALYPECDKALFTIYKRCGDYIKETLQ